MASMKGRIDYECTMKYKDGDDERIEWRRDEERAGDVYR